MLCAGVRGGGVLTMPDLNLWDNKLTKSKNAAAAKHISSARN